MPDPHDRRREPRPTLRRRLFGAFGALNRVASQRLAPPNRAEPVDSATPVATPVVSTPDTTPVSTPTDPAAWWDHVQDAVSTPIADLVDGFDLIASHPIPYGGLPRRAATMFSAELRTWSDLADETITSLTGRPKAGIATVRAMLIAAQRAATLARQPREDDAGTATRLLFERLTPREYAILSGRRWALDPITLEDVAARLGIDKATVVRFQPRSDAHLRELLSDPAHRAVKSYAKALRRQLGPLTRPATAEQALHQLGLDLAGDAGQLLLHVAGPFRRREGWLEDSTADGLARARAAVEAVFDDDGAPTNAVLLRTLHRLGVPKDTAADFLAELPGLRRFTDRWVRWEPNNADRAAAGLLLLGAPATAAAIADRIGEPERVPGILGAMSLDDRFVRVSKQSWALAAWGTAHYGGLAEEIGSRIDAAGGVIAIKTLLGDIKTEFPDVAVSSIRSYLKTLAFVVEQDNVRRRREADEWPPVAPLNTVRGTFCNGPDELRVAFPVNADLLRGSGLPLNPPVAVALGVEPGRQRSFTVTAGPELTVRWVLTSTNGARIGSLRGLAATLGAELGDTLVLAFDLPTGTATATRITRADTPRQRLQTLLGRTVRNPEAALARSLQCRPEELPALLDGRDERELLCPPVDVSAP